MMGNDQRPAKVASRWRRVVGVLAVFLCLFLGVGIFEAATSYFQSRYFTKVSEGMTFALGRGPSNATFYPEAGPYDERLGYVRLDETLQTLGEAGFVVMKQARVSGEMIRWARRGVGPVYEEKSQSGLEVRDQLGRRLYSARYPQRVYANFEAVPPVIVETLLFIENRELLQTRFPHHNPAVEWDRLARAVFEDLLSRVRPGSHVSGGSTLATQIEKFRHSPGGWTSGPAEKARQIFTASVRAYRDGRTTLAERESIVVDYLNSVPLAAAPERGEVNGIGDGLWEWFGAEFADVNALLAPESPEQTEHDEDWYAARALAYRRVLSLMIAQRRPDYYLRQNPSALEALTAPYLRLLADAEVIDRELCEAALAASSSLQTARSRKPAPPSATTKAAVSLRSRIASLVGAPDLYTLDRWDLTATTTLDSLAQQEVAQILRQLKDPAAAAEFGLLESRLLQKGDLASVVYSVTLYERVQDANLLRVQADTFDGAVNLNEGGRLELGSTAKLRTLVTYLEIVARVHRDYHASRETESPLRVPTQDAIGRWVVEYLTRNPDANLQQTLEAAMERPYSASPAERFFTGGGVHTFSNFDKKHDTQVLTVRSAFRQSVNLVFIRLMRDVVRHYTYGAGGPTAAFLEDSNDTLRLAYLQKFADREGSDFLRRFYRKYQPVEPERRLEVLLDGVRGTPKGVTVAFRSVRPDATPEELAKVLAERRAPRGRESGNRNGGESAPAKVAESVADLYDELGPDRFSLVHRGFLAGVHPLELWLVGFLTSHPEAAIGQVLAASAEQRQQVYTWLFQTKRKDAQDIRIKSLLEVEAFLEIQRAWARLGYPFAHLVPSYATAIGSSGDRPAALAELMGVIANDGVRQPIVRVTDIHLAANTPYETVLQGSVGNSEPVLDRAIARLLRQELAGVVEHGTARRAFESVMLDDGAMVPVGGKTGTGDNRTKAYSEKGQLTQSTVMNRTATFVFLVGDRFFGSIVAYVPGEAAGGFDFTSALPVQIWKILAGPLRPLLTSPTDVEPLPSLARE